MKSPKILSLLTIFSFLAVLFGIWFIYRAGTFGVSNVFSSEHVFLDGRSLDENVAIELTAKSLKAEGHDILYFSPVQLTDAVYQWNNGKAERILARYPDGDRGRVQWVKRKDDAIVATYAVTITRTNNEFRCRVIRQK